MIRDITLGQYFPGDSFLYKMDPRAKIVLTLVYLVMIFVVHNYAGYLAVFLLLFVIIKSTDIPFKYILKGIKPIMVFVAFTAVLNLFMTGGDILWQWGFLKITKQGINYAIFMVLRIVLLMMGTSMLTYTTSPIVLTDGIERLLSPFAKIGLPAHELAMMMTIALRFVPTLLEETEKIIKAQTARGADFESGNIIQVGGQAVLGRQCHKSTPWLTERHGYDPTYCVKVCSDTFRRNRKNYKGTDGTRCRL